MDLTVSETVIEIFKDNKLKINLISSCINWVISIFNFYLITFYLKSVPGSIYLNSICFASADLLAYLSSGLIMKYF